MTYLRSAVLGSPFVELKVSNERLHNKDCSILPMPFFLVMGTFKTSMSCSHWKHHHLSMYFLCSCFVTGKIHTRLIYNIHFPPCGFLTHPQDVQVSQSRASLPRCLQPLASGRQMSLVQLCPEVARRHHHYHHHHHHYYYCWWFRNPKANHLGCIKPCK